MIYLVSSMVSQYLVWLCWRLLLLLTVALHPLVAQPVQDGAALVADGGARLVVVLHPGVRPPSHLLSTVQYSTVQYSTVQQMVEPGL